MKHALALLGLLFVAACDRGPSDPVVARAWVRLPAVAGQPAAAYFTLEGGRHADALEQVASAVAARIELHDSMAAGGMAPLARVALPAGSTIPFAPGGKHAMIYGLDPAIVPGTAVPLRFGFAGGKTAEAEAKTVAAGADAPF